MLKTVKSLIKDLSGVTSLEYAVLAAIMVVGLAAILTPVKSTLQSTFSSVSTALTPAAGAGDAGGN